MSNNKPKHFLILKIVGFLGIAIVIIGLILIFTGFGNFEVQTFMIGGIMLPLGCGMAFMGITMGFGPEFARLRTQTAKYIQNENKEDLSDIASNAADIMSEAVTKTAQAAKAGLQDSVYCKYCGAEIDTASVFCNKCGNKQ